MNLLALLSGGKGKGGDSKGSPPDSGPDESPERMYAKEAFSAVKDDDEDGFIEAFTSAIQACMKKKYKDSDEPDADDDAEA